MLMGRITPIVPRFSATIVEPKLQRLLKRYGVTLLDVFRGLIRCVRLLQHGHCRRSCKLHSKRRTNLWIDRSLPFATRWRN